MRPLSLLEPSAAPAVSELAMLNDTMQVLRAAQAGRARQGGSSGSGAALASYRALLRATVEAAPDGVVALDLEGRVIAVNARLAQVWGLDAAGLSDVDGGAAQLARLMRERVQDPAAWDRLLAAAAAAPECEHRDQLALADGRRLARRCLPQVLQGRVIGTVVQWQDLGGRPSAAPLPGVAALQPA